MDVFGYVLYYNITIIFLLLFIAFNYYNSVVRMTRDMSLTKLEKLDIIYEPEFVEPKIACEIIGCTYFTSSVDRYEDSNYTNVNDISIMNDDLIIMDNSIFIVVNFETEQYYIPMCKPVTNIGYAILEAYLFVLPLSIMLIWIILLKERKTRLEELYSKESDLQYSILYNVAYIIHHDLKSPLMVLKSIMDEVKLNCLQNTKAPIDKEDLTELLDMGDESVNQIYQSIQPLTDYNSVKFSNGDKSIYDLVNIAYKMVKRTNITGLKYFNVDKMLNEYILSHESGMSNGLFLNMFINHLKNSIEANSTAINVYMNDKTKEHLLIYIEDNGDGINHKVAKSIYEKNFTTKHSKNNDIRGLGLYLNKYIITTRYKGDDYLVRTNLGSGSTFCIKVLYGKKGNLDYGVK